ncbi:heavy-metal-associated domain-containing protein [Mesoplasma lactucae]|uniref:Uncharacterized protein n=1 Tax=Mesoplasma lactucae ATCC 49193 TaxID=81460 RepID=A0A291IQW0_9MOLU|nr:heavy-metal-associated domain-containing protein [Mesoplasma lactucae]ATG97242.1 hypothetical protein CP520_00495 [Mesoplasma lactucae ATCC 49193]ATZ20313.1 hypothetical protein MLACT_v1c04920 [Mesoplasma lactucae ATCC 49193]MCL8216484.1 hypothetical protein [Mesoplasma lactucae ATCC 49193]
MQTIKLNSKSISCEGCRKTITKTLERMIGVKDVQVDLNTKDITVTFNPKWTNENKIMKKLTKINYPATIVKGSK